MTFQPGANLYTQGFGSRPENVEVPHIDTRAPTSQDIRYPIGKVWVDTVAGNSWTLTKLTTSAGVITANWAEGGNAEATTSTFGIVRLATLSQLQNGNAPAGAYVPTSNDVATVIAGIVVGAVPPANEFQQGIAFIATQADTNTGTNDTKIVTPLKLATYVAGGSGAGSFTNLTATGTVSFTGATGGITMTSATASSFGTTGAGIDLTLSSAAGQVIINGEEAAANAVRILSAAGGLDVDVALQMNLTSSQNAVDAVRILASAGGIDIDAVGAATEDINITNTGGSIVISATENVADSIQIVSTAGGIDILASAASAGEDIDIIATGSSVNVSATENAALAITLNANGGTSETIRIRSEQGTGAASVGLFSTAGGVTLSGGIASANALNFTTSNAAGGITMTVGTAGILPTITNGPFTLVTGTGGVSISADATNNTLLIGTGAGVKTVTLGSVNTTSTTAIQSGSGVLTITSTGGALTINSGVGALGISTDASITSVNIGTGGAVKTIAIGGTSANVITIANLQTGGSVAIGNAMTTGTIALGGAVMTGPITIGAATNATGQTVNISSATSIAGSNIVNVLAGATPGASQTFNLMTGVGTAGTYAVNILTGNSTGTTQTVSIANGLAATTIVIGNVTSTSGTTLHVGTGNFLLDGAVTSTYTIGTALGTGPINIGLSTAGQTVAINNAASNTVANVVNILNGATPGANNTLNIMNGAGAAGTQTVNILASGATRAGAVNIATGVAAHAVTIGQVTTTVAVNGPQTNTLASGSAVGITINTSAGTGRGLQVTSSAVTVPDIASMAGGILVTPTDVAAGASPQVANNRHFKVVFNAVSIAASAVQALVITNSTITGASTDIMYSWSGTTAGSAVSLSSVVNAAGQSTLTFTNGVGATTTTSNITVIGWVMN